MEKGNAPIRVRLPEDVKERLYEKAAQEVGTKRGRAGGASLVVRRLIYEYLGEKMPPQYGEKPQAEVVELAGRRRGRAKGVE